MGEDLTGDLQMWVVRYEVRQTLKSTPAETVEVVWRIFGPDDEAIGPFVRRTVSGVEGTSPYEEILRLQVEDRTFAHQPFIYECDRTGSELTVIMQYVEGQDLTELVETSTGGTALLERVVPGLFDGVAELHEGLRDPIVHGSITPANVIVGEDRVFLLGLRTTSRQDGGDPGDLAYVAPEVMRGRGTGIASDVYALGMVCAFCCTGEHPTARLVERRFDDWRIPPDLAKVLVVACADEARDRFESVRAFKAAVVDALGIEVLEDASGPSALGGERWRAAKQSEPRQGRDVVEDASSGVEETLGPKDIVGIAWDVVVAGLLVLFYAAVIAYLFQRTPDDRFPVWTALAALLFVYVVPATIVAYLIAYKRPFRRFLGPLASLPKRLEILYGVLAIVCSFTLAMLAFFLTGAIQVFV